MKKCKMKKVQQGKSATRKECNTKKDFKHEKSATWK